MLKTGFICQTLSVSLIITDTKYFIIFCIIKRGEANAKNFYAFRVERKYYLLYSFPRSQ